MKETHLKYFFLIIIISSFFPVNQLSAKVDTLSSKKDIFVVGIRPIRHKWDKGRDHDITNEIMRLASKRIVVVGTSWFNRDDSNEKLLAKGVYGLNKGMIYGLKNPIITYYYSVKKRITSNKNNRLNIVGDLFDSDIALEYWRELGEKELTVNDRKLYDQITNYLVLNGRVKLKTNVAQNIVYDENSGHVATAFVWDNDIVLQGVTMDLFELSRPIKSISKEELKNAGIEFLYSIGYYSRIKRYDDEFAIYDYDGDTRVLLQTDGKLLPTYLRSSYPIKIILGKPKFLGFKVIRGGIQVPISSLRYGIPLYSKESVWRSLMKIYSQLMKKKALTQIPNELINKKSKIRDNIDELEDIFIVKNMEKVALIAKGKRLPVYFLLREKDVTKLSKQFKKLESKPNPKVYLNSDVLQEDCRPLNVAFNNEAEKEIYLKELELSIKVNNLLVYLKNDSNNDEEKERFLTELVGLGASIVTYVLSDLKDNDAENNSDIYSMLALSRIGKPAIREMVKELKNQVPHSRISLLCLEAFRRMGKDAIEAADVLVILFNQMSEYDKQSLTGQDYLRALYSIKPSVLPNELRRRYRQKELLNEIFDR
jgi:hypothetical protein